MYWWKECTGSLPPLISGVYGKRFLEPKKQINLSHRMKSVECVKLQANIWFASKNHNFVSLPYICQECSLFALHLACLQFLLAVRISLPSGLSSPAPLRRTVLLLRYALESIHTLTSLPVVDLRLTIITNSICLHSSVTTSDYPPKMEYSVSLPLLRCVPGGWIVFPVRNQSYLTSDLLLQLNLDRYSPLISDVGRALGSDWLCQLHRGRVSHRTRYPSPGVDNECDFSQPKLIVTTVTWHIFTSHLTSWIRCEKLFFIRRSAYPALQPRCSSPCVWCLEAPLWLALLAPSSVQLRRRWARSEDHSKLEKLVYIAHNSVPHLLWSIVRWTSSMPALQLAHKLTLFPSSFDSEINGYRTFLGLTKEDDYTSVAQDMKRKGDFTTPGNNVVAIEATRSQGSPVDGFLSTNEQAEAQAMSKRVRLWLNSE